MEPETHEQMIARTVAQTASDTARAVREAAEATAMILAEKSIGRDAVIAVLRTNMDNLEKKQAFFEETVHHKMDDLGLAFEKVFKKLEEIALGRPTWAVSLMLGGMFSLCVGLIVFLMASAK